MRRPPVIDAHCHAGHGDGLTGPWDTDASLDRYRCARRGGRHRPDGAAGPAHLRLPLAPTGRSGAIVRAEPRRYLGFAFVNPVDRPRPDRRARRRGPRLGCLRDQGPLARRPDHPRGGRGRPAPATAGPVRPGRRHRDGRDGGAAYPDVAWIVPHLSSFADDWKAQIAFVDQLVRLPNLFTDTSGVRYFDVLADAVRRAGPHKVLFGSDGPFLHPGGRARKIHALRLPPRTRPCPRRQPAATDPDRPPLGPAVAATSSGHPEPEVRTMTMAMQESEARNWSTLGPAEPGLSTGDARQARVRGDQAAHPQRDQIRPEAAATAGDHDAETNCAYWVTSTRSAGTERQRLRVTTPGKRTPGSRYAVSRSGQWTTWRGRLRPSDSFVNQHRVRLGRRPSSGVRSWPRSTDPDRIGRAWRGGPRGTVLDMMYTEPAEFRPGAYWPHDVSWRAAASTELAGGAGADGAGRSGSEPAAAATPGP